MKFDMHCHTKEGSLDGKVTLSEYVTELKKKGFHGMLITDHNSYNAYRYYKKHRNDEVFQDFVVLKGIEYDTIDAGHILVIMPETVSLGLLELRGLPVSLLIEVVHFFGGILGPAHPCGEKYLSITNTRKYRKNPDIIKHFDFVETFNACESASSNQAAQDLADAYGLAGFGGSDAHKVECSGLSFTDFDAQIACESDLIRCIRAKLPVACGGSFYHGTTKEKIGRANDLLIYSFWVYNKFLAMMRYYNRRHALNRYHELRLP